ncbi:MAG: hypothetical protein M3Y45_01250 [Actinomycetota bacterium]|nr:hypothetical protein [Actinomycetota bacterium]
MKPLEPVKGDVILVGDPRRAFALAQELTVQPRMSHQARGLWGYTGETESGRPLTVQSTGSGGPSAIPVIGDLAETGATRMVRLGTCISSGHAPGEILLVEAARVRDGASRSLLESGASSFRSGEETAALPDADLLRVLEGLGKRETVASHDLVGRFDPGTREQTAARDLQTAATLTLARQLGIPAAALLIVAGDGHGEQLEEAELEARFRPLSRAVLDRLERLP